MTDLDKNGQPFGRLEQLEPTAAWIDEPRGFTPWLAANLDRLSDVLGMQLELEAKEVAVETFSADILARDAGDGSFVLIENQFTQSDHTHLGQIMTYLSGLGTNTVVWIAPRFREPHLSAIRWLNEHTEEPFAFFAVELKVVRIGSSPIVPIFDVVERPNDWERRLHSKAKEQRGSDELSAFRRNFWTHYVTRHPGGLPGEATSNRWHDIPELELYLSLYVTSRDVGLFVRGRRGIPAEVTSERLAPVADQISSRVGAEFNGDSNNFFFIKKLAVDNANEGNWDRSADWLKAEVDRYESALKDILGGKA